MPQVQVVDLGEDQSKRGGVLGFLDQLSSAYKENKDKETFNNLLGEYQKNREQEGAFEKLQVDLMKSDIAPTRRLEMQQQLNQGFEAVNKQNQALNAKAKLLKDNEEKKRASEALRKAGATEDQIAIFEAADQGGRTKVIGDVLETKNRTTNPTEGSSQIHDYDAGLTPKERVKRQDARFTTQTPLVMKNSEALTAAENEGLSIDLLDELTDSGKVGEGLHNLNINPKTGDLFLPKGGTKEEQLFVKTVNDFTVKAKDSFGARVTNFELDRFMQRLPTLANSAEGRKLILRQMKIINEINQLEKRAIQDVFDEYGVRNIDYADAENIARTKIKDQKEELRKEYLNIEKVAKSEESEFVDKAKANVKDGFVVMKTPDGKIKQFPKKNLENLINKGYKKL